MWRRIKFLPPKGGAENFEIMNFEIMNFEIMNFELLKKIPQSFFALLTILAYIYLLWKTITSHSLFKARKFASLLTKLKHYSIASFQQVCTRMIACMIS